MVRRKEQSETILVIFKTTNRSCITKIPFYLIIKVSLYLENIMYPFECFMYIHVLHRWYLILVKVFTGITSSVSTSGLIMLHVYRNKLLSI